MTSQFPHMMLGICKACSPIQPELTELKMALARDGLADNVRIRAVPCLGSNNSPFTIVMQAAEAASYVFSGVSFETDVGDIVATCRHYLGSPNGWMEDARPCGRLRFLLKARTPA